MKRRDFLKTIGVIGGALPVALSGAGATVPSHDPIDDGEWEESSSTSYRSSTSYPNGCNWRYCDGETL